MLYQSTIYSLSFALTLVLAFFVAQLTWSLIGYGSEERQSTRAFISKDHRIHSQVETEALLSNLLQKPLFGTEDVVKVVNKPIVSKSSSKPKVSKLPLKLVGVVTGSSNFAIIKDKGQQRVYAAGDVIKPYQAVVTEIKSDSMFIRYRGATQQIFISK